MKPEWEQAGMSEAEFWKYRYFELRRQFENAVENYLKEHRDPVGHKIEKDETR